MKDTHKYIQLFNCHTCIHNYSSLQFSTIMTVFMSLYHSVMQDDSHFLGYFSYFQYPLSVMKKLPYPALQSLKTIWIYFCVCVCVYMCARVRVWVHTWTNLYWSFFITCQKCPGTRVLCSKNSLGSKY